jgi:hypothetical protein
MQKRYLKYAAGVSAAVSAALILANCSGGNVDDQHDPNFISQAQSTLTVPGVSSAVTFSFDLGQVDPATHIYYVTDRTNKAITAVNLNTKAVFQFKPTGVAFAGCGSTTFNPVTDPRTVTPMPGCVNIPTPVGTQVVNNDTSGPDGLDIVGPNLYVGDVNALYVLDKGTGALVKKLVIPSVPGGLRADEGCFDPVNHIYGISTPGADHPFMTFFNVTAPSAPVLLGTVIMDQPAGTASAGLEACVWDTAAGQTGMMFVNNDGNNDPAAPAGAGRDRGEMDGIPATSILALGGATVQFTALAGIVQYSLPDVVGQASQCDPTGIALGAGTEIGAMCRTGTLGRSLNFVILNKTTGAVVATVVGAGGGDQITYDPTSNKWYLADSRSTKARTSCGAGTAITCPLTPQLGVVDGTTHAIVAMIPNGNNSHSVAVDSALGKVITPFTNNSASGGGSAFPGGGINIFATR